MNANDLRIGDIFTDCSAEEWDKMSRSDQRKRKRVKVLGHLPVKSCVNRLHLRTSAGDWCIPTIAPVVLLDVPARRVA